LLGRLVWAMRAAFKEAREGLPATRVFMMFCRGEQQQGKWVRQPTVRFISKLLA
jgi:hypothetical protein